MIKDLANRLKSLNLMQVSLDTGISLTTLQNIASGRNDNPQWKTIETLQNYLEKLKNEPTSQS